VRRGGAAWWVAEVRRDEVPLPLRWVTTMSLEPGPWSEAEARVLRGLLTRVAAEEPKGLVLDGCMYWMTDGEMDQRGNLAAAPAARALTRFVAALGSGPQRWRATRSAFSGVARYAAEN